MSRCSTCQGRASSLSEDCMICECVQQGLVTISGPLHLEPDGFSEAMAVLMESSVEEAGCTQ